MAPLATIFTETIGAPGGTTAIGSYTGWSNNGTLTFTGTGDVRSTGVSTGYAGASAAGNVFLTNAAGTNFQIAGINTSGYTALTFTVGVFKSTTTSNGSDFAVEVSTNGTTYTPLSFTPFATGGGTANWRLVTLTGTVPSTPNLRLRFTNNGTATQYRIDDVQLSGTLSCPSLFTVNNLGDASDAAPGDGVCATASSVCTLRAAIEESQALTNCGTPIEIHFGLTGTINLGSSLPTITRPVNLNGNGANALTIAGNDTFRLVNILLSTAGTMNINDLTFTHGRKAGGANAAAIEFNNNGTLNINRSEFINNTGPSAGAADGSSLIFSNAAAALNITGCTIRGNQVEHVVEIGNTPFNITNSTISNNTGTGAAVFIFGGVPNGQVNYSTIANNNQGIWHANGSGASAVTIKGSLLSQNGNLNVRRTPGGCPATTNQIVSAGHNLIDDGSALPNLCTVDPTDIVGASVNTGLAALADNGGTTQTRALDSTSAAIDGGAADAPPLDQRGIGRVGTPDIGAFENQLSTLTVNSLGDTGAGSGVFGDLRYCLTRSQGRTDAHINFSVTGTINLSSSLPQITRGVSIDGPGANLLTVAGNNTFQLVNILLATPATVNINDLSFSNGRKSAGANAAAVEFNNNGTLNLNRDEFFNNTGPSNGAADGSSLIFSNAAAALNITGCTLRNNSLEHIVEIGNTPFNLTNSTISNNGGTGAALFIFGGVPTGQVNNSTIANNNQGIWHANNAGTSIVTIKNTVLSQNGNINLRRTPGGSPGNQLASNGFNLVDDNSFSQFVSSQATDLNGSSFNPQLGPLAYYGGSTRTRALFSGSAAIDKGGPGGATDQRGLPRPFDNPTIAPAAGGNNSDIGAVELQASCNPIVISPSILQNGNTSNPYGQSLSGLSGTAPYSFSVVSGALPPGMTLAPSGAFIGTPTATGAFSFTVVATDAVGCSGTRSYTLNVISCNAITVSPTTLPNGNVLAPYNPLLSATGGAVPYAFTVTSGTIPTGLTLNPNGTWSGLPTTANTFNFTVTATDTNGCTGSRTYTVTISAAPCGTNFVVNDLGDAPDAVLGDGACATSGGVCTLRAAIQEANAETSCPGTISTSFNVVGQVNLSSPLPAIAHNLTIDGFDPRRTTINGASGGNNGIFRVNPGITAAIRYMTITNGLADFGGGVRNDGNLTLEQVAITNSRAVGGNGGNGGAGRAPGGIPGGAGGGIFNSGTLSIAHSYIADNSGTGGNGGRGAGRPSGGGGAALGGGIYSDGGSVTITNTTIVNNSVTGGNGGSNFAGGGTGDTGGDAGQGIGGGGGGGNGSPGDATGGVGAFGAGGGAGGLIPGHNGGAGGFGAGGGGGNPTGGVGGFGAGKGSNDGSGGGGGAGLGGGVFVRAGTLNVINSTITGNRTAGGIANFQPVVGCAGCTNGTGVGGGLFNQTGTATLQNTIVALNNGDSSKDLFGTFTSTGGNLVGSGTGAIGIVDGTAGDHAGTDAVPIDPQLAPLGFYGGLTQTRPPFGTSTAINAGSNTGAPSDDQRFHARPAPAGSNVDIGAVEVSFIVNDLGDASDANPGDGICATAAAICTLRAALEEANAFAGDDIIGFSVSGTITPATMLPSITDNAYILNANAGSITVSPTATGGVFEVGPLASSTFFGLTVQSGNADGNGGGIRSLAQGGRVTEITNCVVQNNTAGGTGGGIYNNDTGTMNITNTTVRSNQANVGGGGAANVHATINITGSTFSDNSALIDGGGFDFEGFSSFPPSLLNITNSTFSGNSALRFGGALKLNQLPAQLLNSTFTLNSAQTGGGIYADNGGQTVMQNNVVAGNTAFSFAPDLFGLVNSQGHNLIGNNLGSNLNAGLPNAGNDYVGTAGSPLNPQLHPLGFYGGPTQTQPPATGSLAIDKGGSGTAVDQRGLSRPFDVAGVNPAPGGNSSDIGAVELQATCPSITVNPATLPPGDPSIPYSQTLTAAGGSGGYTYTLLSGELPTGLTLSPAGLLSGTPTANGTFNFSVIANDASGCFGTRNYSVAVFHCNPITVAPATLPNADQGQAYPHNLSATGGAVPHTFAVTSGSTATGLTLNPDGTWSGTAGSAGGPFNFTVTATDANGCTGSQSYSVSIVLPCATNPIVNDLGDAPDAAPGDGACLTAGGVCTLRAAVQEVNAAACSGPFTIGFSVTGTIAPAAALPQLTRALTINGPGPQNLTITAGHNFRVLDVNTNAEFKIKGLTLADGQAPTVMVPMGDTLLTGGGVVFRQRSGLIENCVIRNSSAVAGGGLAAGSSGTLTIINSTFTGNTSITGGGAVYAGSSTTAVVENSTFSDNVAGSHGGAIHDSGGTDSSWTVLNSTFSHNTANNNSVGGAVYVVNGTFQARYCTFTLNHAAQSGGAIYQSSPGILQVGTSVVAQNTAGVAGDDLFGFVNTFGGNVVGTNDGNNLVAGTPGPGPVEDWVGDDDNPLDAHLGPLASNGGPTQTHALLCGSIAIDLIDANFPPDGDQRGVSRPQGARTDAGAFEGIYNLSANPPPVTTLQVGKPYLQNLSASGGTAPYSFIVSGGSLPAGVTLSSAGVLSGTPTAAGTFPLSVQIDDGGFSTGCLSFTLTVINPAPLDFDADGITDYAVVRNGGSPAPSVSGPADTVSDDPTTGAEDPIRGGTRGAMHRGRYFRLPGEKFDPLMPRIERANGVVIPMRWLVHTSGPGADINLLFGTLDDFPVPADYDGDGRADLAVWTGGPAAQFRVLTSSSNYTATVTYNLGNDACDPSVVGDYDGDGRIDPTVFNVNTGQWQYLGGPAHATLVTVTPIGTLGGVFPIQGDFDGDGKFDFMMVTRDGLNPTSSHFYQWLNNGTTTPPATANFVFGNYRDVVVPGDYDGDGKTDLALASVIVNPIAWRIRLSPTGTLVGPINFGDPNIDYTMTGDYDGNQKGEFTLWHVPGVYQSLMGPAFGTPSVDFTWGQSGDYPVAYFNSH
jgi:CSLREA domain-containing protein